MFSSRNLHRLLRKIVLVFTICLVIFNEFTIFHINQRIWTQIDCSTANCTRILLVADPQLVGNNEGSLFKNIAMIDSDRYLKKTFSHAFYYSKPNVICFLGDLLEEGSSATLERFKNYAKRFHHIFHIKSGTELVHVPGDHDIGGRKGEYISNSNVRRFEIEFTSKDIFDHQERIRFFKINRMQLDFNNPKALTNQNRIRIGISHMPILTADGSLRRNFLYDVDPHVIFSGHWHDSRIVTYPVITTSMLENNEMKTFNLAKIKADNEYLEIMIPTSSYMMGTSKIGYGLAVIENQTLHYTVLWTWSRYLCLKLYLLWMVIVLAVYIILQMGQRMFRRLSFKRLKRDKMELLSEFEYP